jgi:N-acetylglucosamine-6-phosphate deacetylase
MSETDTTRVIIHSARKLDVDGLVDDFWLASEGDTIVAVGHGSGWREHVAESDVVDYDVVDAGGHWLTPGFIDLHCHGGGGFSFDTLDDDTGASALIGGLAVHRAHGTTRSVISLVSNPIDRLLLSLALIADLTAIDPLVLGSHLEGPFLSPGQRGAHNPAFLCEPGPEMLEELLGAARGTLRQLTIAPELPDALEAIGVLTEAGVVVAVGHTEADYDLAARAFEIGARILTHAFNAMPGIHHRKPGPVLAAVDNESTTLELVLDGVHVHPRVAKLAFEAAPGRIALITDAMAATDSADGHYTLGSLDVTVFDGRAVLAGTTSIAGSTLTQDVALRIAVASGVDPRAAVEALTATPAAALSLDHRLGRLKVGYAADAVLLNHEWAVQRVWAAGRSLRDAS